MICACQWREVNAYSASDYGSLTGLGLQHVEALLAVGADSNLRIPSNRVAAMSFAVKYTDVNTIKALLRGGADVTLCDSSGHNLLFNVVFSRPPPSRP